VYLNPDAVTAGQLLETLTVVVMSDHPGVTGYIIAHKLSFRTRVVKSVNGVSGFNTVGRITSIVLLHDGTVHLFPKSIVYQIAHPGIVQGYAPSTLHLIVVQRSTLGVTTLSLLGLFDGFAST
jgi:hypothetical protein